jgi:hypothetical protein
MKRLASTPNLQLPTPKTSGFETGVGSWELEVDVGVFSNLLVSAEVMESGDWT